VTEPAAAAAGGTTLPASAAAFNRLRREPLVRALVVACGATECHLVGGVLRDRALGIATCDFDAVVAERGREIAEELARRLPARFVLLGGKEFAAYRLVVPRDTESHRRAPAAAGRGAGSLAPGTVLDLWDRAGTSLHEDMARRDFTVNSFALDPRSGEVIDPFGGLGDLARRTLRATTPGSLAGDPLRVLRLVRLLLDLPGFSAELATLEQARHAAPGLSAVAAERIRDELARVLSHDAAENGLRLLALVGVYPALWTGALGRGAASAGSGAGSEAIERAAAELAALPRRAAELAGFLEGTAAGGANVWQPIDLTSARFAATLRYLAAGTGGSAPRPELPPASAPRGAPAPRLRPGTPRRLRDGAAMPAALRRMIEAGYLAARLAGDLAPLLAAAPELPDQELERRRFLNRHGRRWLAVAVSFGAAATVAGEQVLARWRLTAAALCELARREGATLIAPPRLVTGEEVQELLGVEPGPAVGRALAALARAQVDGLVKTRAEAERFLRDRQARTGGTV
jgi:tRNA nucleotidyltransferase/poly(A) polymerase